MSLRFLVFLLVLGLTVAAPGGFIAPDLRPALFQKDRIPLDPDRMRELAGQLGHLIGQDSGDTAAHARARAQLLALASRFDPANPGIRATLRSLENGFPPTRPPARELGRAEAAVWRVVAWLQQEDAGAEGQHLAALLLDPLRVLYPKHPAVQNHDPTAEAARWDGVVAPVEQFAAAGPPEAMVPEPRAPEPAGAPAQPEPGPWAPPIALRENRLHTPLFVFGSRYRLGAEVVPLSIRINESEQAGPLTYGLSPSFNAPQLDRAREESAAALLSRWPRLPEQNFAVLSTDEKRYARRNDTAIAGPATLLLHACLSGAELRGDLVFVGTIAPDGSILRPPLAWDFLDALRSGKGGRLLVPPDMRDELAALIVLEDPGFFLKYEVLVVSSLDTALALGTPGGDPANLATSSATFATIRNAAQGRNVGQLVVMDSVRERLGEIHSAVPFHLSAEMLLLQGSGTERPAYLSRAILARELSRILDPVRSTTKAREESLDADRVLATWTSCRKEIDGLQKYVELNDRPLFRQAFDLINELRTFSRVLKDGRDDDGDLRPPSRRHLKQIEAAYGEFVAVAAAATGDPLPPEKVPATD